MAAAESLRPAPFPRAKAVARPATDLASYRAKGTSKNLKDERRIARESEQHVIGEILALVSNEEMAERFGSPGSTVQGAQLKAGGQAMTSGELAFLVPLKPALRSLVALMKERVSSELCDLHRPAGDPQLLRMQLLLPHLDALCVVIAALE
jgi:hypothetical protein